MSFARHFIYPYSSYTYPYFSEKYVERISARMAVMIGASAV
jgi:hypothetical protein